MSLDAVVKRLADAGLDLSPTLLLDAIWLALQPGLTLFDNAAPAAGQVAPPIGEPIGTRKVAATPPVPPPPTTDTGAAASGTVTEASVFSGPGASSETIKASPIRIPAGAALPGKLALARAMRPFRARRPSPHALELDEERTVDLTADRGGHLQLTFRPRSERWYEAIVVVEEAPSMDVWHETIAELVQMLRDTGAFRDVGTRTLSFVTVKSADGGVDRTEPVLSSGRSGRVAAAALGSDPIRRIIFFATHGISARWRDASLAGVLQGWTRTASVVILHLLPANLWRQTALGEPRGHVRAGEAGAPTSHLQSERFEWDMTLSASEPVVAVPVIPLDPAACLSWAQMQMGRGRRAAAMLIPTTPTPAAAAAADEAATKVSGLSVAEQVAQFKSYASPLAFRLAVYLAPGPFTLPVARLIQAARFGNAAQQSHLAEVLLSGLFYRVTRADSPVAPDWVQYDAVKEAREILLRSLREEDAHHIASILEQHVNRYIAETYGKPADFRALVRDARGHFELPDWAQPFATIGEAILKLHGTPGAVVPSPPPQPPVAPLPESPPAESMPAESMRPQQESRPHETNIDVGTDRSYRVLVVGTSGQIDDELSAFARDLGRLLAEWDYNLTIGGWDGVDRAVAEGFARVVQTRGQNLEEWLVQAIPPGAKPSTTLGHTVLCETDHEYEAATIARANVVVLIGGRTYTERAGRRALEMGVPVVPIAATGGAAAGLFEEMRRSEYATFPTLAEPGPGLAVGTLQAIDSALRPETALPTAARAYLRARDVALADYIETRMSSWGEPALEVAAASGDGLEHDALRACLQKVAPTREGIAEIFGALDRSTEYRQADLNLIWLRLMAVRAAFADSGVRASLSPELEMVFTKLYGRLDDGTGTGGMAGRLKTSLAGPFGRLARLIKAAGTARNPDTTADRVPRSSREVLDDAATLSCLRDLDPGWRAVGLGRQFQEFSINLLPATLDATRFESTYRLHLDLCLAALGRLTESASAAGIRPEDRDAIDLFIGRRERGWPSQAAASSVSDIRAWLEGGASTSEPTGARAAVAEGWAIADQWANVIADYDQLRERTEGPERTAAMNSLVSRMRQLVQVTPPDEMRVVSQRFIDDPRSGWRLAGYVVAHEIGDETDIRPLCQSLKRFQTPRRRSRNSNDNRPFGDYWGLQALRQVMNRTAVLSGAQIEAIRELEGIAPAGTDRAEMWSEIERRVTAEGGTKKGAQASAPSSTAQDQPAMVFINYRRDDTREVALRLVASLTRRFGSEPLFTEKAVLQGGQAGKARAQEQIPRGTVFLSLIGQSWLEIQDADGKRRLDDPADWVRQEIEFAITNKHLIYPILVDGASMPRLSELPGPLKALYLRKGLPLRSGEWDADLQAIFTVLEAQGLRPRPVPASRPTRPPATRRPLPAAKRGAKKKPGKKK